MRLCRIPVPELPEPVCVGDHIKRERVARKLRQRDVAEALGVNSWTIVNWERGGPIGRPCYYPVIIAWLGYVPLPEPKCEGERLRHARLIRGLTSQEMADEMGIDQSTLLGRERG